MGKRKTSLGWVASKRAKGVCVCGGGVENGEQGQAGLRDAGGELDRGRE